MKNFCLNLRDAYIERLMNLAALEGSPLFREAYLDALYAADKKRLLLRRTVGQSGTPCAALTGSFPGVRRCVFCAKCNFPSPSFWALRSKFLDLCAFMPSIPL